MKFIVAVIKHHRLNDVKENLAKAGIQGLTVTEVKGFGRQKGHSEMYRGAEYQIEFVPKVKIELALSDDQAAKAVDLILDKARTGKIGDGKLFVFDLEEVVRIRTGERGKEAL